MQKLSKTNIPQPSISDYIFIIVVDDCMLKGHKSSALIFITRFFFIINKHFQRNTNMKIVDHFLGHYFSVQIFVSFMGIVISSPRWHGGFKIKMLHCMNFLAFQILIIDFSIAVIMKLRLNFFETNTISNVFAKWRSWRRLMKLNSRSIKWSQRP